MNYTNEELNNFMARAIKISESAVAKNEVPVGCVIVNRKTKKIESEAHNETNTSRNGTRHCEIVALEKMINRITYLNSNAADGQKEYSDNGLGLDLGSTYDLFVTVEPCIMCIGFIDLLGIKHIFFGCKNYRFGGCGSVLDYRKLNMSSKISLISGICGKEAVKILKDFYEIGNPKAPENKRKRQLRN